MVQSNGAWVQLRNFIEPAVAEARARKELLNRRRRGNQHLFDREERREPPSTLEHSARADYLINDECNPFHQE